MPAIILTGHPRIGKTEIAHLIAKRSTEKFGIEKVIIVNEENALIHCKSSEVSSKSDCYKDSHAEKVTRAALKSAFERALSSSSQDSKKQPLVILDSLNYIKGYRYELHCISKSLRQQHCVFWVLNDQMNKHEESSSSLHHQGDLTIEEINALVMRYEAPDERNRWDKPLYKIDLRRFSTLNVDSNNQIGNVGELEKQALHQSVYNMHDISKSLAKASSTTVAKVKNDDSIFVSIENDIDEVLNSFLNGVKPLVENLSTAKVVSAKANVLHDVDRITQQVISRILSAQKSQGASYGGGFIVQMESQKISFDQEITTAELRKLRRQFIKWVTVHPPKDCSSEGVSFAFLTFIGSQQ